MRQAYTFTTNATDLSKESRISGNWYGIKLTKENKEQVLLSRNIEQGAA